MHTASPHQTLGHGFLIAQPLFDFSSTALKIVPKRWFEVRSAHECTGRGATDPSPVCSDYLERTKTILSLIAQFFRLGTLLQVQLISEQVALSFFTFPEPHLGFFYIQLTYLARSAYYIACRQGWDCCFVVYEFMMVYVFLTLSGTIGLS